VPVVLQVTMIALVLIVPSKTFVAAPLVMGVIIAAAMGYFRAVKMEIADGYFRTCFPLFLPLFVAALLIDLNWIAAIAVVDNDTYFGFINFLLFITNLHFILSAVYISFSMGVPYYLVYLLAVYGAFAIAFAIGALRKKRRIASGRSLFFSVFIFVLLMALAVSLYTYRHPKALLNVLTKEAYDLPPVVYDIHSGKAVSLRGESTISIESNWPIIGGAAAFYPIYSSAAEVLFKRPYNLTHNQFAGIYYPRGGSYDGRYAYERLINKDVDMILAFAPSDADIEMARKNNIELQITPIGREAFVILSNEVNPVHSLTVDQIQKIYSDEITNWREVGGENEKILTFRQFADSDSQIIMERVVMKDFPFAKPPSIARMYNNKGYRNADNAIGYSLKFFAETLQKNGVRQLAINGVEPKRENIQNGSYPLVYEFYIVTRKNDVAPNAQKLIDWFLSDQGQALIEDVGYVPITSIK
jgi:phosphate transport system substrate-binding protein